jgi:hypothetical protein
MATVVPLSHSDLNPSSQNQFAFTSRVSLSTSTMRVPTTAAFSQFLLDNGHSYPFSRLQVTRSSFFCKWVMQKGHSNLGFTYYFPTMANSLPVSLLQAISIDGVKPLPPDFSSVMDDMFWWGKSKSFQWYKQVVDMIGLCLYDRGEVGIRNVVRELIGLQVKAILLQYFDFDSLAFDLLFDMYWDWFFFTYSEQYFHNHYSFRGIAEASFDYIEACIAQVNYHVNAPVTVPSVEVVTPERSNSA